MQIPNFEDTEVVGKDGKLTPTWKEILSQVIRQLQNNYSAEGLFIPQQTDAAGNITKLDNANSKGALIYNNDTHKVLVNLNGTFKEIQTL